jgi:glutathione synthase
MKLCFFVNDLANELPTYTTTRLAMTASARGHDVWYIDAGDFACDPDDVVRAHAWHPPQGVTEGEAFLADAATGERQRVGLDEFHAMVIRNDPADDLVERPWAQNIGLLFGELAARHGVVVLNDPVGMARAVNKLYLEHLPRSTRPESVITRNVDDVREFVERHGGEAVLKPLQGSGGEGVFFVHPEDGVNLDQMVGSLARDGYLAAQEVLPNAQDGDIRLFLVDGEPLQVDGTYAAFRRVPAEGEARSNMRAGGRPVPAEVDDAVLELVEAIRPQLVEDGMFLVGLDIIDARLVEINVFSPGGIGSCQLVTGVDFTPRIVDAIERHVAAA